MALEAAEKLATGALKGRGFKPRPFKTPTPRVFPQAV
jgi:hypothetical protein